MSARPQAQRVGVTDQPSREDSLAVSDYVAGFADFIVRCPTPMTLAVQGDWGSGKTTALNAVKKRIKEKSANDPQAPWIIDFNTWQYSQFDLGEELVFSLLETVLKELSAKTPPGKTALRDRLSGLRDTL